MSLANVLLESASPASLGMTSEDIGRYNYADGHRAIYAETAMELRDVFESTFYVSNQVEFQAIYEGTSVDESYEYQQIMEGIFTSGFQKLAEVVKRLWAKIVAFFAQIKSKFLTMTRDNEKFVEKFNRMIKGKSLNLAGFRYNVYTYTNIDDFESLLRNSKLTAVTKISNEVVAKSAQPEISTQELDTLGESFETAINNFYKQVTGTEDEHDINDALWSHFRGGAKLGDDKPSVGISSLDEYLKTIKSSKSLKDMDTFKKDVDKEFSDLIKTIKDDEKKAKGDGTTGDLINIYRKEIKTINKLHSKANTFISIWRTASMERVSAYRNICHAAVAYGTRRK